MFLAAFCSTFVLLSYFTSLTHLFDPPSDAPLYRFLIDASLWVGCYLLDVDVQLVLISEGNYYITIHSLVMNAACSQILGWALKMWR